MQVSEVLRIKGTTLFVVAPEQPLSEAVAVMAQEDIGSLVVMDRGKLVGMLTFREILRAMSSELQKEGGCASDELRRIPISQAMIAKPIVASPGTEVDELRRLMLQSHQRYLPVMKDRMLLGVVSFHDIARAVLEEQGFENRMLKAYIRDWPAEG